MFKKKLQNSQENRNFTFKQVVRRFFCPVSPAALFIKGTRNFSVLICHAVIACKRVVRGN